MGTEQAIRHSLIEEQEEYYVLQGKEEIVEWVGFRPVSYTHLDVYKRQEIDFTMYQHIHKQSK